MPSRDDFGLVFKVETIRWAEARFYALVDGDDIRAATLGPQTKLGDYLVFPDLQDKALCRRFYDARALTALCTQPVTPEYMKWLRSQDQWIVFWGRKKP